MLTHNGRVKPIEEKIDGEPIHGAGKQIPCLLLTKCIVVVMVNSVACQSHPAYCQQLPRPVDIHPPCVECNCSPETEIWSSGARRTQRPLLKPSCLPFILGRWVMGSWFILDLHLAINESCLLGNKTRNLKGKCLKQKDDNLRLEVDIKSCPLDSTYWLEVE